MTRLALCKEVPIKTHKPVCEHDSLCAKAAVAKMLVSDRLPAVRINT